MKKNISICIAVLVMILLPAGSLSAKSGFKKKQFTLYGGLNMFSGIGAESDYETGVNDFPVTPAYSVPVFGIGLTFLSSSSFAVGFEARYGLAAKVDLRDPTDGETVPVDTPKNLIAALDLFKYFNLSQQMQLFISLGAGAEYRLAEDKEYTGSLGTKIRIGAPANPISPLVAAGIGWQYLFAETLGINLEFRAAYIIRDPAQLLLTPALGLVLKF